MSAELPATVFGVATALMRSPEQVAAMKQSGWEIASHALKWIEHRDMPEEVGTRPDSRGRSYAHRSHGRAARRLVYGPHLGESLRLVTEETDVLYSSDSYADDLPYWVAGAKGPHLIIPYTLDANDMRFVNAQGFSQGEDFFQYLKDSFDLLYAEGEASPKMMSVGLHCRLTAARAARRHWRASLTMPAAMTASGSPAAPTSPGIGSAEHPFAATPHANGP